MQFAGNSPYFYAVSFWACTLTTFLICVRYEIRTLVNAHSICMRHFWRSLLGYVMLSAKWYKSGILSSDTRSYIFAKRLSCNAFSLSGSISSAFKYKSGTSHLRFWCNAFEYYIISSSALICKRFSAFRTVFTRPVSVLPPTPFVQLTILH